MVGIWLYHKQGGDEAWYLVLEDEYWYTERTGKAFKCHRREGQPSRIQELAPSTQAAVTAAFQKAIDQWMALLPEPLRPAALQARTCKCGCKSQPRPKGEFATDACRLRYFRQQQRKAKGPGQLELPIAQEKSQAFPRVVYDNHGIKVTVDEQRPGYGSYTIEEGTDAPYIVNTNTELVEFGILKHLMNNADRVRPLERTLYALIGLREAFEKAPLPIDEAHRLHPALQKKADWIAAIRKVGDMITATKPTFEDRHGKPAQQPAVWPKGTPASERARWEKIVIDAMTRENSPKGFDYMKNFLWCSKGHQFGDAEYERPWVNAFKRLVKARRIETRKDGADNLYKLAGETPTPHGLPTMLPLRRPSLPPTAPPAPKPRSTEKAPTGKTIGLTKRIEQLLETGEHRIDYIVASLGLGQDKFTSVRSAINLLFLNRRIGRRPVPGADSVYSYASTGYYELHKLSFETSK